MKNELVNDMMDLADELEKEEKVKEARRIANKLIYKWCIQRDADEESRKDYDLLLSRDIGDLCKALLSMLGYGVKIREDGFNTAYLQLPDDYPEEYKITLKKDESLILLFLYRELLRSSGKDSQSIITNIFVDDLILAFDEAKTKITIPRLKEILYKFESYNMIRIDTPKIKFGRDTVISVLPSIACFLSDASIDYISNTLEQYKAESARNTDNTEEESSC